MVLQEGSFIVPVLDEGEMPIEGIDPEHEEVAEHAPDPSATRPSTPCGNDSETEESTPRSQRTSYTHASESFPCQYYPPVSISHLMVHRTSSPPWPERQPPSPAHSVTLAPHRPSGMARSPSPVPPNLLRDPWVYPPGHRDTLIKLRHLEIDLASARAYVQVLEETRDLYRELLNSASVSK
ncbi:hypothetical protein FA13DRAFT_1741604 [Coprinellus micaceus]|uniref:Uncharacterized protein n=1 Tax=Coprinellus micaceus TaxID=71717 RepID=A0A4Y7SJI7_COPMI|nr:hypothetical protein FA13DRAFT_1741604 [Coprinellus micaceus]